jgi:hypothetical protein
MAKTPAPAPISVTIKNGRLVVDMPINSVPVMSATGKTLVIASTHGNIETGATYEGHPVVLGLNAYFRNR